MVTDTIITPVHPGEILLTEFLEPLALIQYQLAKAVDVPPGESMRSSTASAASAPTPPCVFLATSVPQSGSG
jgi:hypothetical protein